jgi:RNA polymerase sigma-70 factor (ECF subfamily)
MSIRNLFSSLTLNVSEPDSQARSEHIAAGPALALDDIYRREAPRLLRFFNRRVAHDDVPDLVQESFVKLAHAETVRDEPIAQPEAYLNRIATNLLRNRAKSAAQKAMAKSIPVEDAGLTAPDLVATLEARDLINRTEAALKRLSPKTKDIFLAHRIDGLSYKDIADRLDMSEKGVEWHMTKAIAHLDRILRSR